MGMTWKEFQKLSKRTQPFNAEPTNNQELYSFLGNYALGTLGEYHELQVEINKVPLDETPTMDLVNLIEKECGDFSHYLVGLLSVLQQEFNESKLTKVWNINDIEQDLSNVAEIIKKYVHHGHSVDEVKLVDSIYKLISYVQTNFGITLPYILEKNIEKLKIRYPEKFNSEDSIKRKDVK